MSDESIKDNVKVCMFDQYGTVVDMQGGLTAIATPFLKAKGWSGDPNSFVTWWRRTHFENSMIDALLHREHTPYREIGHRAVAHVMDRAGIQYTKDDVRYLVGEIEKLKPFPEVPAALAKLQTKIQARRALQWRPRHAGDGEAVSRHPVRPRDLGGGSRLVQAACRDLHQGRRDCSGLTMDQILFVANHAFDCIGAKSAGMRTAFIDRRSRPFGETPHQPDILVPTMKDLADAIV